MMKNGMATQTQARQKRKISKTSKPRDDSSRKQVYPGSADGLGTDLH